VVVSTSPLKIKFSSREREIVTLKGDQKMARKCYENSLKIHRGTYIIATFEPDTSLEENPREERNDRCPKPVGNTREIILEGKKIHIGTSLNTKEEEELNDVLTLKRSAFP